MMALPAKRLGIFITFIILGFSPGSFALLCSKAQSPLLLAYLGTGPIFEADLPFNLPDQAKAFYLGKGRFGGKVYRVEFSNGQNLAYKHYNSAKDAASDFNTMQILFNVSQGPEYKGFKVAKPLALEGQLMILEYRRGEALANLVGEGSLPGVQIRFRNLSNKEHIELLQKKCRYLWVETFRALQRNFSSIVASPSSGGWLFADQAGKVHAVFLHRGNIVVDIYGNDFSIIDPK